MIPGWMERYRRIALEFGYDASRDREAALALDGLLEGPPATGRLRDAICGRAVFCVGAGPSLESQMPILRANPGAACIAADSAVLPLTKLGIAPAVVVTDLDGDLDCLMGLRDSATYAVHAHGDNMHLLPTARLFGGCVGTTQAEPVGRVQNFGGFTDGDRAVFLAHHFGARAAVLLGMDMDGPVSGWTTRDPNLKLKKLRAAAGLLEWLATFSRPALYTASSPLRGFKTVSRVDADRIVRGP